jgi:hypothetical protein
MSASLEAAARSAPGRTTDRWFALAQPTGKVEIQSNEYLKVIFSNRKAANVE